MSYPEIKRIRNVMFIEKSIGYFHKKVQDKNFLNNKRRNLGKIEEGIVTDTNTNSDSGSDKEGRRIRRESCKKITKTEG